MAPWENIFILKNKPTNTLGALDKFPLEVIQQILGHVDMDTLRKLRFANRRGAEVAQSLLVWHTINQHVPFILPLLLKKTTSTARYITVNSLCRILQLRSGDWR